jgi:hypothetical protein
VEYVRIIGKIAEVLFNVAKVLGGNWSAIAALVMSVIDLHAAWQGPRAAQAL